MARAKTQPTTTHMPAGCIGTPRAPAAPTPTGPKSAKPSASPAPVAVPATVPAPTPAAPVAIQQASSKQAGIIAGLRRPEGVTIPELMRLTGWLSHSVRGALSGALKRKLGLVIASSINAERGRVYRIVDPVPAAAVPKRRRPKQQPGATAAA